MLHTLLHDLFRIWFGWVEAWGYAGVFVLMAMESSIIPVPSEIVMPPAAFWAAQGRMSMAGVIAAGTAGSWLGSALSYFGARWVGLPVLNRYGKYILLGPDKIAMAQSWVNRYGAFGIFVARFLPVVRHLVSMPAGILGMPFIPFSVATTIGAGLWCAVLAWFGQEVIGNNPELLQSPDQMIAVIKSKLHWLVAGIVILAMLYAIVVRFKKQTRVRA